MASSERANCVKALEMDNSNSPFNTKFMHTHLSQGSFPGLWTELVHGTWMHSICNVKLYNLETVQLLDEATKTNSVLCIYKSLSYSLFRRVHKISKSNYKLHHANPSFHLSVRPHGKTWFPLERFSCNLMVDYYSKFCHMDSRFFTIWQEWRVLYIKTRVLYDYVSLNSSQNNTCFRQNLERKSKRTF